MRLSLTNTAVAKLEPRDKPYEARDSRVAGFLVRVQPSGVKTFYVEYARGKRIRIGRADILATPQARNQARGFLAAASLGSDPKAKRLDQADHTLRSFIEDVFRPWADANIRSADATVARLKSSFPDFLDRPLGEISPWLVEKWRSARLKSGIKPATANRDLADLKSCFSKATAWGALDANPLKDVKLQRLDPNPIVRFLSEEEESRLRGALDEREERIRTQRDSANAWRRVRHYPLYVDLRQQGFADYLKPLVLTALNTGLRRGELLQLKWADIDLDRAMLSAHGQYSKSGKTRHVPLNSEALATLRAWHAQSSQASDVVFADQQGNSLQSIKRSWANVLKAAGIEKFRWHDLRHHFASLLVMAGVDLNTVRELLGHANFAMTLRYAHLAPEHKALAVEKIVKGASIAIAHADDPQAAERSKVTPLALQAS